MNRKEIEKIKLEMFLQGISQKDIARTANVDPSFIANVLCGRYAPSPKVIAAFKQHDIDIDGCLEGVMTKRALGLSQKQRERIKLEMALLGLNQADIAKTANINFRFISNVLCGREKPSAKVIRGFKKHGINIDIEADNDE